MHEVGCTVSSSQVPFGYRRDSSKSVRLRIFSTSPLQCCVSFCQAQILVGCFSRKRTENPSTQIVSEIHELVDFQYQKMTNRWVFYYSCREARTCKVTTRVRALHLSFVYCQIWFCFRHSFRFFPFFLFSRLYGSFAFLRIVAYSCGNSFLSCL